LEVRPEVVEADHEVGAVALRAVAVVGQADEDAGPPARYHAREARNRLALVRRRHSVDRLRRHELEPAGYRTPPAERRRDLGPAAEAEARIAGVVAASALVAGRGGRRAEQRGQRENGLVHTNASCAYVGFGQLGHHLARRERASTRITSRQAGGNAFRVLCKA